MLTPTGAYLGVESFLVDSGESGANTATVLRHLNAASRQFETETRRHFLPVQGTLYFRWPQYQPTATWSLWTADADDLLSVDTLIAAATGQNTVQVPITHYFLEPQFVGPPFSRIEVDLSTSDAFQSGATPQRSVEVSGTWGYCAITEAAGTLSGAITDTATQLTVSSAALVDVGNLILIDSEQIYVAGRQAPNSAVLTVQRGVNGTAAASHADTTAIGVYRVPAEIQDCIFADALKRYKSTQANNQADVQDYTRDAEGHVTIIRRPDPARVPFNKDRPSLIEQYRRARTGVV